MKQDLTLHVGTKFDGEGMKKLNNGLKNTAKSVGSATQALGAVSSELGQMTGQAGKAAGAISKLFGSFMQGGVIGVAVAAVTAVVGLIAQAFKEAKEAAREAAKSMTDHFSNGVQKTLEGIEKIKRALTFKQTSVSNLYAYANDNARANERQSQVDIRNRYAEQRANVKTELERSMLDAKERKELAEDEAKYRLAEAKRQMNELSDSEKILSEARMKQASKLMELTNLVEQEERGLENSQAVQRYKALDKALQNAQKTVAEKGEGAVVGQRKVTNTAVVSGAVVQSEQTINVTAKEMLVAAKKAMDEFISENEGVKESLESYKKNLDAKNKAEEDLRATNQKLTRLGDQVAVARRISKIADEEYSLAMKNAAQQYKDDIKNAKEKEKKDAEAKQKAAEAELKTKQKAAEAELKTARQEELKARRLALQKELDEKTAQAQKTALQQLNEKRAEAAAAKELAEAEKKAADVLNQWAQNRKNNPNEWGRDQDAANKEKRRQAEAEAQNVNRAKGQVNTLAKELFNADNSNGLRAGADLGKLGRFAQMSDFLGAGNVTESQRNALQKQADALRAKLFDNDGNLKVSRGDSRIKTFDRIRGLLEKMDTMDKAKRLQAEQKQREEKKARDIDEANKAIKEIRDKINALAM